MYAHVHACKCVHAHTYPQTQLRTRTHTHTHTHTHTKVRTLACVPVGDVLVKPSRIFFRLSSDLSPFMFEMPVCTRARAHTHTSARHYCRIDVRGASSACLRHPPYTHIHTTRLSPPTHTSTPIHTSPHYTAHALETLTYQRACLHTHATHTHIRTHKRAHTHIPHTDTHTYTYTHIHTHTHNTATLWRARAAAKGNGGAGDCHGRGPGRLPARTCQRMRRPGAQSQ